MMQAVYLSHNGMTEALGQRQVLPYLRGLSAGGVRIDLFACEPPGTGLDQTEGLRQTLLQDGIRYTPLRRRPSHGLRSKLLDCGQLFLRALLRASIEGMRPRIIHARSHLPGAVAAALARIFPKTPFVFDCRGLLAEEYADLGHWRRGGVA